MPSFLRSAEVINSVGHLTDESLLLCHDYAPLISHVVHILSAKYGDRNGWIEARYTDPGLFLIALGPVAKAMRLTKPQVAAVLDALAFHGHLERSEEGAVRMAGYADMVERHTAEAARSCNSANQKKRRHNENGNLDKKCNNQVEPCNYKVEPCNNQVAPSTLTHEPAAGHDAPAGSLLVQDSHYLGIPSGCSKKEGEREGGVGEGNANPADPVGQCLPLPGMAAPSPASPGGFTPRDSHALIDLAKVGREDPEAPMPVRLTTYFLARLLEVKPDRKLPTDAILTRWVNDMRLLLKDRDNREADIRAVIAWAMTDTRFWQTALQSPGKLRSSFDELEGKTRAARRLSAPPPPAPVMRLVYSESIEASIAASKSMKPTDVMRMFPDRTVPDVVAEAQRDYPALTLPDAITALKARYDEQREVCHA